MALHHEDWSDLLAGGNSAERRFRLQLSLTAILDKNRVFRTGDSLTELWRGNLAQACVIMAHEYDDISILQTVLHVCHDIPLRSSQSDLCCDVIRHGHDPYSVARAIRILIQQGPTLPSWGLLGFIRGYIRLENPQSVQYAVGIQVGSTLFDPATEELYYQLLLDGAEAHAAHAAALQLLS